MKRLHLWHQTKTGLVVFFVLEAALAYCFASLAIDRGSLWYYLLTLVFTIGALQNIGHALGKAIRRSHG